MSKFFEFLKKNKKTTFILLLAVFIATYGIPLLINWAFSKPAPCDFLAVDWDARDALSYYGSVLGFLGTVILSGLALWQNHVIQEANNKHTALLEQMEHIKNAPRLAVKATLAHGKAGNVKVQINNISDNIAESLCASGFAVIDESGLALWRDDSVISIDYLHSDRTWEIEIGNPQIESNKHQIVFMIKYNDKFGGQYTYNAIGTFGERIVLPKFRITQL